jgi:hypothetical protein
MAFLRFLGGFLKGGLLGLTTVSLLTIGGCLLSESGRKAAGRVGPGDAQQEALYVYLFMAGAPLGIVLGGTIGGVRSMRVEHPGATLPVKGPVVADRAESPDEAV